MVTFYDIWWYLVTFHDIWWYLVTFHDKTCRLSWYVMTCHDLDVMTNHEMIPSDSERHGDFIWEDQTCLLPEPTVWLDLAPFVVVTQNQLRFQLRVLSRYDAKIIPPCSFPSTILLLDHLSEIWVTTFWHLVKKLSLRFLKDGPATELLREMCKGGVIFSVLASYLASYLAILAFWLCTTNWFWVPCGMCHFFSFV